jgi:hypothetical protein
MMRNATSLVNELTLAARFGHPIVLVAPGVLVLGETGAAIGANGSEMNVLFSAEQAGRMAQRLLAESADGQTAD